MSKKTEIPPVEYLKECFLYDHVTGVLHWRKRPKHHFRCSHDMNVWNTIHDQKPVGNLCSYGYMVSSLNGRKYRNHRLIYTMIVGSIPDNLDIDHINGVRNDNRIENLRIATKSQNSSNIKLRTNNTSGTTGVWWVPKYNRWSCYITHKKKKVYIGHFKTIELAAQARVEAERRYHGEFSSIRSRVVDGVHS